MVAMASSTPLRLSTSGQWAREPAGPVAPPEAVPVAGAQATAASPIAPAPAAFRKSRRVGSIVIVPPLGTG